MQPSAASGAAPSGATTTAGTPASGGTKTNPASSAAASAAAAAAAAATTKSHVITRLLEEHLSGILKDALAIQRHAKRARLHHSNVVHGSRVVAAAATGERPALRRRLHAADVNLALQLRGCERLYATNIVGTGSDGTTSSSLLVDDASAATRKLDLEAYLRQESFLEPPTEVAVHRHWLAVDGVQPEIPENPDPVTTVLPFAHNNNMMARPAFLSANHRAGVGGAATATALPTATAATSAAAAAADGGLQVHRLQAKMLSEELRLYYERVHLALERGNATAETAAQQELVLTSLARDTGLQELVPFLVRYLQSALWRRIAAVDHCRTLVRAVTAMLHNPHLHLELHMHELIPALFSCVVAKRLPQVTVAAASSASHWALRRDAALALRLTCHVFGADYANLQAKMLQPLCSALEPHKGLASRYGGLVGITLFGPKAIDAYLLPVILACWEDWERALFVPCASATTTTTTTTLPSKDTNDKMDIDDTKGPDSAKPDSTPAAAPTAETKTSEEASAPPKEGKASSTTTAASDKADKGAAEASTANNNNAVLDAATREAIYMCQQASLTALHVFLDRVPVADKAARISWSALADAMGADRLMPIQGRGGGTGEATGQPSEYALCFV